MLIFWSRQEGERKKSSINKIKSYDLTVLFFPACTSKLKANPTLPVILQSPVCTGNYGLFSIAGLCYDTQQSGLMRVRFDCCAAASIGVVASGERNKKRPQLIILKFCSRELSAIYPARHTLHCIVMTKYKDFALWRSSVFFISLQYTLWYMPHARSDSHNPRL